MKTRWMIVGSLLTLVALGVMVVLGGVVLAQPGSDEATPEPPVAEESAESPHFDFDFEWDLQGSALSRLDAHIGDHMGKMWHYVVDWDFGPLGRLADIIGISADELREALADGQTLTQIAEANGVEREELVAALLAELEQLLDLATQENFLDQEQIAFLQEWMTDGVELLVDHPLPLGEEWRHLGFHDWHDLLDAEDFNLPERLADLLGLTLKGLEEAILDGQSLAEIAEANGVEPQAVVDFLTSEAGAELDEAVAAGYLTKEGAQLLRGWIEDGAERIVDNSLIFPNGFELLDRLGTGFGSHLDAVDWEKWAQFDWSNFIGQDPLSVSAEAIGISQGELLAALSDGRSLAEIAEAHGVDLQAVVGAETDAIEGLLDDLAAEGLIPAEVPDLVKGHLDEGIEMFARHGFPFTGDWEEMFDDWAPWGEDGASWMKELFDCCPCEESEGGQ